MKTKSISKFIISPEGGKILNDTTESGICLNTMMGAEDGRFLNRVGNVVCSPLYNNISAEEGDKILVQHNTFRKWKDYAGELDHSNMIGEGNYFVDLSSIYAYNKKNKWYSTNDWIFVDPEIHEYKGKLKGNKVLRPDKGVIVWPQDPIWKKDVVNVGDFITFRTGKYVTTEIDGRILYRIMGKHILINHGKRSHKN